jgi:hypothetical protein
MSGNRLVTAAFLALAATLGTAKAGEVDANLRAELERVAHERIFLGHQSVGMNLLEGIQALASSAGVPIRVTQVNAASAVEPAMLGHAFVPENGKPLKKLQSFEQLMGPATAGVDVALVKFCFVDFNADTDAKALFAAYRGTIDGLRARNPRTVFVHVTAPLTTVEGGPKALLKRLIGRPLYGTVENARREEYNTLIRQAYEGREPVFDLARIESTNPDGTAATAQWQGGIVPALAQVYTDDGGHLNQMGKLRAARGLISVLAAVPGHPELPSPPRAQH